MATPPTYQPPIRHEPACQTDSPASPTISAPATTRLNRSRSPRLVLQDDLDAGPIVSRSTSRRKIADGATSRTRNKGQSEKSNVVRSPSAPPFRSGPIETAERAVDAPT